MRNPHGAAMWSGGDDRDLAADTITCAHCNCVVVVRQDMSNAGFCLKCYDHLCGPCADEGVCAPFQKQLEQFEKGITRRLLRDRAVDRILDNPKRRA